jgi:peptide/nickel transport system substrate-binding protein
VQAPDSLDPGATASQEALEADWLVYTPLLTYPHAGELTGSQVVPGLAAGLPAISGGGRLYTLTLRPGLVYSNGRSVRASDFTWAVERAIRLHWPGARDLIVGRISGAAAYARGTARSISGITADDATGQIAIRLIRPDGLFENVLALPAMAPVPRGTAFRDLLAPTASGGGSLRRRPGATGQVVLPAPQPALGPITHPGIPDGHVDVHVLIALDAGADARSVLAGRADVLDWSDPLPPAVAARLAAGDPPGRPIKVANETYIIFMNAKTGPFTSPLIRQAVATALDGPVISGGAGVLPGCYVLPPGIVGHSSRKCPNGDPASGGDLAAASALIEHSGKAAATVSVWSGAGSAFRQWAARYAALLDRIGLSSRLTLDRGRAQTGITAITGRLPNPAAYYRALLDARDLDDRYVARESRTLAAIPAGELSAVADLWQDLDEYVPGRPTSPLSDIGPCRSSCPTGLTPRP